ncbi:MAG: transporter substrate-binding domain-containing protein [Bacteroidetes bacterium]|nr:transporter substrate-binding domain-containing protein [Bacteroidota bacterium]
MKKFLPILLIVSNVGFAQKYSGDSWAAVNSKGSGTLGVVYYPQAGLIYEEGGKMKGVCAELLTEFTAFVQAKYNKKITVKYLGAETVFNNFLKVCQTTPNILGVTNVTVTEERKKILKFTPAFLSNEETLITHKNAPSVESAGKISALLKGYSAKVIGGSVHVKYMDQLKSENFPALQISTGPSGPEILKEISTNPKLFTILDFTEYVDATRKHLPVKKQNIQIGEPQELAFVMSKQTDWDKIWAEFLTPEFRKSEKYRKVIANNLGQVYLSILK